MPRSHTLDDFKERSNKVHNFKYDYSESVYINSDTKIYIICHEKDEDGIEHGGFWQRPSDHYYGRGCCKCSGIGLSTTECFIKKSIKKHNYKYDYSKVEYKNNRIPVTIICQEHGEFKQKPLDHLDGCGCQKCGGKLQSNTEEFINKAILVHGDRYDYSKTIYIKALDKINIICKEHGEFLQQANNHLSGSNCPGCNVNRKSKIVKLVEDILNENNIKYEIEKTFEWLKFERLLFLDFYLPDFNIVIEVQGEQHFLPVERFGGEKDFIIRQKRDEQKLKLCNENNIEIVYIRKDLNVLTELIDKLNETANT